MTEIVISSQIFFAVVLGVIALVALTVWAVARHYRTKLQQACPFNPDTGMANPETLDCLLRLEWGRLQRGGHEFAIVSFQLDGITLPGNLLHQTARTKLILKVAMRLQQTLREIDAIAHIEGGYFLAFFPKSTVESATVAAERLRKTLRETPFTAMGRSFPCSASFGVALAKGLDISLEDVGSRARAAMDHARKLGGDMVCIEDVLK